MKKFAVGVLTIALVAAVAPAAFAEPAISGYVQQTIEYKFGEDVAEPYTFSKTTLRLNVSGDVGDKLSYYGRIQGVAGPVSDPESDDFAGEQLKVTLAYGDIKNFGVEGLSFRIGRHGVGGSYLNEFGGFFNKTRDAISATYSADALELQAFYSPNVVGTAIDLFSDELFGARVTYDVAANGVDVELAGQIVKELTEEGNLGYGVGASVGLDAIGSAYLEWGKTEDEADFLVVGANIDALKDATGIGAWVEYDVEGEDFAFELNRKLFDGFTAYFGSKDSAETFYLKGEFQVSF